MKNNQEHICGDPNGLCDAECMDKAHIGETERANYYQKQMRQWRDAALEVSAERDNLHARIATLEAALAEAREDSARLDWLESDMPTSLIRYSAPGGKMIVQAGDYGNYGSTLRAAIDAARGKSHASK